MSAPKPCTWSGCRVLVRDGGSRCAAHLSEQRKLSDEQRGTAAQRGYTSAWTKARDGYLRLHPLCEPCLKVGVYEASEVVDHIIPHRGDKALFWDRKNWQAMSKRCHDRKTATQDGGFGRGPSEPSGG